MTQISESSKCIYCKSNPLLMKEVLEELKERGRSVELNMKKVKKKDNEIESLKLTISKLTSELFVWRIMFITIIMAVSLFILYGLWLAVETTEASQAPASTHYKLFDSYLH